MKTNLLFTITLVISSLIFNKAIAIGPPTFDFFDVSHYECIHERITINKFGDQIVLRTEVYGSIDEFSGSCPRYFEFLPSNIIIPPSSSVNVIWEGKEQEWAIPFPQQEHTEAAHNPTCRFGLAPVNH